MIALIKFNSTGQYNYFRNMLIQPMESLTVPRHLVASAGRIYAKSDIGPTNYTPKTIDYRHTIRVITPFDCCHEEEIQRIRSEKQAMVLEKDREIEGLQALLREKAEQLQRKNEEIQRLRQSKNLNFLNPLKVSTLENKLQRSQVTDIFNSNVKSRAVDRSCLSNIKTSFIFDIGCTQFQKSKEVNKVQEEFQNVQNSLKQLASVLCKPKSPYQFFTRAKEIPIVLPPKIEKLSPRINISNLNHQAEQESFDEADEDENESVECTSTNQSFDATDFLQEAIHEHKVLRDTLIELEKSTKAQIQQMKQFYENQIEGYKRMLQLQRDKMKYADTAKNRQKMNNQHRIREEQFLNILGIRSNNLEDTAHLLDND